MELRRIHRMECATVWLCLVLAAALRCSAGRVIAEYDPSCIVDSCKSFNAGTKQVLASRAAVHRVLKSAEKSGGDIFLTDYGYNPGSPRPVPQAPRGRTPRIGVPPTPPVSDITPQVPPPPTIVTPSPPPPPPPSLLQPPFPGTPPLPPLPFPIAPPPPVGIENFRPGNGTNSSCGPSFLPHSGRWRFYSITFSAPCTVVCDLLRLIDEEPDVARLKPKLRLYDPARYLYVLLRAIPSSCLAVLSHSV